MLPVEIWHNISSYSADQDVYLLQCISKGIREYLFRVNKSRVYFGRHKLHGDITFEHIKELNILIFVYENRINVIGKNKYWTDNYFYIPQLRRIRIDPNCFTNEEIQIDLVVISKNSPYGIAVQYPREITTLIPFGKLRKKITRQKL